MTVPKICSLLGVNVGQSFWISDIPDVEFQILEDGTLDLQAEKARCLGLDS